MLCTLAVVLHCCTVKCMIYVGLVFIMKIMCQMILVIRLLTEPIKAVDELINSRILRVWYITDSVDRTGKTDGITLVTKAILIGYSYNLTLWKKMENNS